MLPDNLEDTKAKRFQSLDFLEILKDCDLKDLDMLDILNECTESHVDLIPWNSQEGYHYKIKQNLKDMSNILDNINEIKLNGYNVTVKKYPKIDNKIISGVMYNNIIEFSPNSKPSEIYENNPCILPIDLALSIFSTIYNFRTQISDDLQGLSKLAKDGYRIELSIHPNPPYYRVWDIDKILTPKEDFKIHVTPNNSFLRLIGRDTFGLMMMDSLSMPVLYTGVYNKYLESFYFGLYENNQFPRQITYVGTQFIEKDIIQDCKINMDLLTNKVPTVLKQPQVDMKFQGKAIRDSGGNIILRSEGSFPHDISDIVADMVSDIEEELNRCNIKNKVFSLDWGIIEDKLPIILKFRLK